jgi:hypothetical protein
MEKRILLFYSFLLIFCCSFSQNIGIGITNPTRAKLEVHSTPGTTSGIFGGESTGMSLRANWPGIGFNEYFNASSKYMANGFAANQYLDPYNGIMGFLMIPNGTANANTLPYIPAIMIGNYGNVGIRAAPLNSASLFVTKAGNFEGSAVFGGTTYNSHFHYSSLEDTYIRGGTTGSYLYINDLPGGKIIIGSGNSLVGINNGIPSYPLEIRQASGRGLLLTETNSWEMRVERYQDAPNSALNLLYNGQYKGFFSAYNGDYMLYSDQRLKTGIENLHPLLDKFTQLQPVAYEMKYNNPGNETTVGFIAQDVKRLFPEMVTITTGTGGAYPVIADLHAINYNGFDVITIKMLQEQQQLIKKMQEINAALAKRIERAEALVYEKK